MRTLSEVFLWRTLARICLTYLLFTGTVSVRAHGAKKEAAALITGELRKWHKITLEFQGPNTSEMASTNPFSDYNLTVTFSQGTKTYQVPGYFAADGDAANSSANSGNRWRVHFAPDEEGLWNYLVSFTTGTDVAITGGGASAGFMDEEMGSFTVGPTNKTGRDHRGKGRLRYVGEHYLQFAETGEWFVKAGADAPENMLAYEDFDDVPNRGNRRKSWIPHLGDYDAGSAAAYTWQEGKGTELLGAIKYLADKGMNAFSFLTFSLAGDDENVFPHLLKVGLNTYNGYGDAAQWDNGVYHDRFDVSRLAQWEKIFEYADHLGMYLHFKLQETENDQKMDGGNVGRERKLYYRELVARFSHHLALNWNTGEENSQTAQQERDMAEYLNQIDPYGHLIVMHTYPNQKDRYNDLTGTQSQYTGASLQSGISSIHNDVKAWVSNSANAGKKWVVANDEQGGANTGVDNDPNGRAQVREEVIWGTFMGVGAGVEFYYGYQTSCTDLDCEDHRSRDQKYTDAAYALKFFQQYFQSYLPDVIHDDAATPEGDDFVIRSQNRSAYAVYRPDGGSTSLSLPNGVWMLQWYNPRNGQMQNPLPYSGNLQAPDNNDWVALLTSEGVDPTPSDSCQTQISMSAIGHFPNVSVLGFVPAYADNAQNALAIDATQYKDQFGAAMGAFSGPDGTYTLSLRSLQETDGESTYRVRVDGVLIGEYTNPQTQTDYTPYTHSWTGISVANGAAIQVEFNSATNERVVEGNSFGYARGRWTHLTFTCDGIDSLNNRVPNIQNPGNQQNQEGDTINLELSVSDSSGCGPLSFSASGLPPGLTIDPQTGVISGVVQEEDSTRGESAYLEQNGLVIIEAESEDPAGGWRQVTAGGITYLEATNNHLGNTNGGTISYPIHFSKPGAYRFQYKTNIEGTNTTEHNDSWIRFPNTEDLHFLCVKGGITSEQQLIDNLDGNLSNKEIYYPRGNAAGRPDHGNENPGNNGFFKAYRSGSGVFKWDAKTIDNNGFPIYVYVKQPGIYQMELSERSALHKIDRIALYKVDTYGTGIPTQSLEGVPSPKSRGEVPGASENSPYQVEISVSNTCSPSKDTTISFQWYISEVNARLPRLQVKVYLEGLWDHGSQALVSERSLQGLVPTTQPFNVAPFDYPGIESVPNLPTRALDWVLIEIRDSQNGVSVLARKAVFIAENGVLLDLDGTPGVNLPGLALGNYPFALFHQSHLAVLSSGTGEYSPDGALYDFTTAADQAQGNRQQKPVGSVFCLFAGDYNGNGILNNQDFNFWKQQGATLNQYLSVDADGNGVVNNQDFNLWTNNRSKVGILEIQK